MAKIDGIATKRVQKDFAKGGQGVLHRVKHSASGLPLALKSIPHSEIAWKRTEALLDLKLWQQSPLLASPFATHRKGKHIEHLASFVEAPDLLNAPAQNFGQQLEWAFLLAGLWNLLEDNSVAHGDIAPSNVLISSSGEPYLIDFDNAVIPAAGVAASMRGQFMMLAPELRNGGKPNLFSDRFAWSVLLNICLLRRHPTDSLTRQPSDMDRIMSQGQWPERLRQPQAGDIPITILGDEIPLLFDRAFSLDSSARPTAREWRDGLFQALNDLVTHDCGGMFVPTMETALCPYCRQDVGSIPENSAVDLRITLLSSQQRFGLVLSEGQTVTLGRHNLGGSPAISRRHLAVTLRGGRLLIQHLGRNPTGLFHAGNRLEAIQSRWIDVPGELVAPVRLQIANELVELSRP